MLGSRRTALNATGLIAAARIKSSERHKEAVGRNITVTTEHATKCAPRNRRPQRYRSCHRPCRL